ncbi:hypothetical protein AgCh_007870 [Apium graveolens]
MATSSLSIAAATATSSNPLLFNSRNLPFECSSISIPPSKHTLFTLTIKPNFSFSPLFICSSSSLNLEFSQTTEPQEETEDDQEFDDYEEDYYDDDEDDRVESHSAEAGRLYVGNLPYAMTSSQLADIFAEAGPVISVEIVYDRVTDRSRGFAFVTMAGVEEAKVAIRMFNGSQVGGRTVKVNFPEVPRGGEREVMGPRIQSSYQSFVDSPHKLYAGNLSWSVTSQKLKEIFADQPGLLSAKVIYDRQSGRSQGYGFITFESAESVESALNELNGVDVEGRIMRLNMAEDRARRTPPPTVERNF